MNGVWPVRLAWIGGLLGLLGLAAGADQASAGLLVSVVGPGQRGLGIFYQQLLGTQGFVQLFYLLGAGQQPRLLAVLRVKAHAVRGHCMARGDKNNLPIAQLGALGQRFIQAIGRAAAVQPMGQNSPQPLIASADFLHQALGG